MIYLFLSSFFAMDCEVMLRILNLKVDDACNISVECGMNDVNNLSKCISIKQADFFKLEYKKC